MGQFDSATVRAELRRQILEGVFSPEGLTALGEWAVKHSEALLQSPIPENAPRPGWVCGDPDPDVDGPRCFLKHWEAGEGVGRHTHPNGMLMVVLKGQLEIWEGWSNEDQKQIVLGVGESLVRISDRDGYDHFPHTLGTTEETVSLHLYSQHGRRGRLVPEPGDAT